jgi:hypothetical protein
MADEKTAADKVHVSTEEEEENLKKVVKPETEFEIPVGDGKRKKVFWARSGFDSRIYFRTYFKKRLKDAIDSGVLGPIGNFKGKPEGVVDGKNPAFFLDPPSVDEKTLKVYEGSTLKNRGEDWTYSVDLRVLFFNKSPEKDIKVEYDYFDAEDYNATYNDSYVAVLIFLCARELDNHKVKVFKTVEEVGTLSLVEANEIMQLYTKTKPFEEANTSEEKLKN